MTARYAVRNPKLAAAGRLRVEWAARFMPVLGLIRERFAREQTLRGMSIGCCLHVTTETANLVLTLAAGGARVRLCGSNPLSTQDDVAAHLARDHGLGVFAWKGATRTEYYDHLHGVLAGSPRITMDDGADLISTLHTERPAFFSTIIGGTEETTTGVVRLKAMERDRALGFPIIAVNESETKYMFDNRYGTGQSTLDGILRATNFLFAGATFVVCGYGWCGRGVAMRARGMGANVIVTEVNPVRALEARMDGFSVMRLLDAAPLGDVFVTVTGNTDVITGAAFRRMKDGAIVANSGHFDVEISKSDLARLTRRQRTVRPFCVEHALATGRKVYVLAEGRLVNLSAAEGHPAMVMDMSFANQALAAEHLVRTGARLDRRVYELPAEIDQQIARLKLASLGIAIDRLTAKQKEYMSSWREGT